jgi:hypothetical protein
VNPTRDALQRIATHVLARARFAATGKFGLRATPGGFGTPAFGQEIEVIRVAETTLVRERSGRAFSMPLNGFTLAELAAFVDADLSVPFDVGHDSPPLGDPTQPVVVDETTARELADWWHLGWQVLDTSVAGERDAMAVQLWPEHFDAGTSIAVGEGANERCNAGASPGDSWCDEPYLYVGPWDSRRPGDASYWNAPFGAVLLRSDALAADDPFAAAVSFVRRGFELLK